MALTDSCAVENTYDYDVFGAVRSWTGSEANTYEFTGEQIDFSTGLQYLRARYYDPGAGRFVSKDPLLESPGWVQDAYTYGRNNPISLRDPSGLDPSDDAEVAAPSIDRQYDNCTRGYHQCIDEGLRLMKNWKGIGFKEIAAVCKDMLGGCTGQIGPGRNPKFDLDEANDRLKGMSDGRRVYCQWF